MKRWVRTFGIVVAIAAGYYFVRHASAVWKDVDLGFLASPGSLAATGVALLAYLLSIPVATAAWRRILGDLGIRMRFGLAYAIVATTQFAKYLPGNVAQHIGRVVVARRHGGGMTQLASSLIYENVFALIAGIHIALVFLTLHPSPSVERWLPMASKPLLLGVATTGAVLALLLLPQLVNLARRLAGKAVTDELQLRLSATTVVSCYCALLGCFLVLGISFALLALAIAPGQGMPFLALCGAFATAWVVGLLVPGAPAGLGVREGVLLALLQGVLADSDIVAVIIALRATTTVGDFLHFIAGAIMLKRFSLDQPRS